MQLEHGFKHPAYHKGRGMIVELEPGEKISGIRMANGSERGGVEGVYFIEIFTTRGQTRRWGAETPAMVTEYYPYDGCEGLKGFFGGVGEVVDKLATIWGR